jgi:hypothetical protein
MIPTSYAEDMLLPFGFDSVTMTERILYGQKSIRIIGVEILNLKKYK